MILRFSVYTYRRRALIENKIGKRKKQLIARQSE